MTDEPQTGSWYLCEHPERPIDKHARAHFGCDGCMVACQAAFHRLGARARFAATGLSEMAEAIRDAFANSVPLEDQP